MHFVASFCAVRSALGAITGHTNSRLKTPLIALNQALQVNAIIHFRTESLQFRMHVFHAFAVDYTKTYSASSGTMIGGAVLKSSNSGPQWRNSLWVIASSAASRPGVRGGMAMVLLRGAERSSPSYNRPCTASASAAA